MFELKRLPEEGIPAALDKAERYRLLNAPGDAESICLDILAVDPDNQDALIMLVLSLADQLLEGKRGAKRRAMEVLSRLADEYDRAYYAGIIYEREAKAKLIRSFPGAGYVAYDGLRRAMVYFEEAEKLAKHGTDQANLRWNSCARIINDNPSVEPAPDVDHHGFLE